MFGCKWNNGAALIDNDGRYYYGNVSFNPEYQTGTITFPETPYGCLTGPYAIIITEEDPIIELKNLPMKKYNGKAHPGNTNTRFLECDIIAEFKTQGMGDMKMEGCGYCYDRNSNAYDIIFQ